MGNHLGDHCEPWWCSVASSWIGYLYITGQNKEHLSQRYRNRKPKALHHRKLKELAMNAGLPCLGSRSEQDPISCEELVKIFKKNALMDHLGLSIVDHAQGQTVVASVHKETPEKETIFL